MPVPETMMLFRPALEGRLVDRPNRFLVRVEAQGRILRAHCANPGRLLEILTPGREVLLEEASTPGRATRYTLAAARYAGKVIPLISSRANQAARRLLLPRLFPAAHLLDAEPQLARSRLDFALAVPGRELLLEVKACTLSEHGVAMFPDAPTDRGRRHLEELTEWAGGPGREGHVLFVVFHADARVFVPSIHTDPAFATTLRRAAGRIGVHAASVRASADGRLAVENPELPVDLEPARWAAEDRGAYLLVIRLDRPIQPEVGSLGRLDLSAGYYVYVGSARRGLSRRMARHLRRRKRLHWHVDHLVQAADRVQALPIVTPHDLECTLARDLGALAHPVPRFGSSDCGCGSHLFTYPDDPLQRSDFLSLLLRYRHFEALRPTV